MNFPIELFLILGPMIFLIIMWILLTINKYYKLWRYKPENDKGRRAEESRGIRSIQGAVSTGGRVFSPTNISPVRQDSPSTGVSSPSPSKTFNPYTRFR